MRLSKGMRKTHQIVYKILLATICAFIYLINLPKKIGYKLYTIKKYGFAQQVYSVDGCDVIIKTKKIKVIKNLRGVDVTILSTADQIIDVKIFDRRSASSNCECKILRDQKYEIGDEIVVRMQACVNI